MIVEEVVLLRHEQRAVLCSMTLRAFLGVT
jgi:hypothetical protein